MLAGRRSRPRTGQARQQRRSRPRTGERGAPKRQTRRTRPTTPLRKRGSAGPLRSRRWLGSMRKISWDHLDGQHPLDAPAKRVDRARSALGESFATRYREAVGSGAHWAGALIHRRVPHPIERVDGGHLARCLRARLAKRRVSLGCGDASERRVDCGRRAAPFGCRHCCATYGGCRGARHRRLVRRDRHEWLGHRDADRIQFGPESGYSEPGRRPAPFADDANGGGLEKLSALSPPRLACRRQRCPGAATKQQQQGDLGRQHPAARFRLLPLQLLRRHQFRQ